MSFKMHAKDNVVMGEGKISNKPLSNKTNVFVEFQ